MVRQALMEGTQGTQDGICQPSERESEWTASWPVGSYLSRNISSAWPFSLPKYRTPVPSTRSYRGKSGARFCYSSVCDLGHLTQPLPASLSSLAQCLLPVSLKRFRMFLGLGSWWDPLNVSSLPLALSCPQHRHPPQQGGSGRNLLCCLTLQEMLFT